MSQDDYTAKYPTGNPASKCHFSSIPDELSRCLWLSSGAKLVYGTILKSCGDGYRCSLSVPTIAMSSGLHDRQIKKHTKLLEDIGLISKRKVYNKPDIFTLHLHPSLTEGKAWIKPESLNKAKGEEKGKGTRVPTNMSLTSGHYSAPTYPQMGVVKNANGGIWVQICIPADTSPDLIAGAKLAFLKHIAINR